MPHTLRNKASGRYLSAGSGVTQDLQKARVYSDKSRANHEKWYSPYYDLIAVEVIIKELNQ